MISRDRSLTSDEVKAKGGELRRTEEGGGSLEGNRRRRKWRDIVGKRKRTRGEGGE